MPPAKDDNGALCISSRHHFHQYVTVTGRNTLMSGFTENNEMITVLTFQPTMQRRWKMLLDWGGGVVVIHIPFNLLSASRSCTYQLAAED